MPVGRILFGCCVFWEIYFPVLVLGLLPGFFQKPDGLSIGQIRQGLICHCWRISASRCAASWLAWSCSGQKTVPAATFVILHRRHCPSVWQRVVVLSLKLGILLGIFSSGGPSWFCLLFASCCFGFVNGRSGILSSPLRFNCSETPCLAIVRSKWEVHTVNYKALL